ncbi:glycosyltransferase [Gimesia aquarii]|uniref:Chondroitin synthase n=1 Tax=Gimesia aquarii TaxID=2527964 RepID=A0A517WX46_9PLAN|nr:glycosyltransferase [Gimesia aquarii]QDU09846.1 Chondroitin synthase [Gimesia aquarii]
MSFSKLRASVIVPVYNRSSDLKVLLSSLMQQSISASRFEILICDDGSTENIQTIVEEFQSPSNPTIKYFKQVNQGPGAARNLGLSHSVGTITAFTDSDCIPDSDWLEELIVPIESSNARMTGGLIDFQNADYLSGRCMNFLMSSMIGAGGARDPRTAIHMKYFPRTSNVAVAREVAVAAGGFPAQRHGEDIEFADRVRQQGAEILFVPTAKITHNEQKTLKQLSREAYLKGCARVRLAKTRGMHELIHAAPALLCLYIILLTLTTVIAPTLTFWSSLPVFAYLCLIFILALQAGICLNEVLAVFVVFSQAILMHISYGCGYLATRLKLFLARLKLNYFPTSLSTENKKV